MAHARLVNVRGQEAVRKLRIDGALLRCPRIVKEIDLLALEFPDRQRVGSAVVKTLVLATAHNEVSGRAIFISGEAVIAQKPAYRGHSE